MGSASAATPAASHVAPGGEPNTDQNSERAKRVSGLMSGLFSLGNDADDGGEGGGKALGRKVDEDQVSAASEDEDENEGRRSGGDAGKASKVDGLDSRTTPAPAPHPQSGVGGDEGSNNNNKDNAKSKSNDNANSASNGSKVGCPAVEIWSTRWLSLDRYECEAVIEPLDAANRHMTPTDIRWVPGIADSSAHTSAHTGSGSDSGSGSPPQVVDGGGAEGACSLTHRYTRRHRHACTQIHALTHA